MTMECPACAEKTGVIDSRWRAAKDTRIFRTTDFKGTVSRRRRCQSCGHRFTTHEFTEAVVRELLRMQAQLEHYKAVFEGLRQSGDIKISKALGLKGKPVNTLRRLE